MGREIRRVPPNWEHPAFAYCKHKPTCHTCYQPLHDQLYEEAANVWLENFAEWQRGERPDYFTEGDAEYFWDWDGMPPDKHYFRTYKDEEATWYQVYETVSEGTPVTPPFETEKELIEYLVEHGDFWAQKRNEGAVSREAAKRFVYGLKFAPSIVVKDGKITVGIESCGEE